MEKVNIAGVGVSKISLGQAIKQIVLWLEQPAGKLSHVVTPNPEMILMAQRNPKFRYVLNEAAMAVADGVGLQMAADYLTVEITGPYPVRLAKLLMNGLKVGAKGFIKSTYRQLPERVPGSDLLPKIIEARPNTRVYFLGGGPDVAVLASKKLKNTYPQMIIAGISEGGVIDSDGYGLDDPETIKSIQESGAELLVVCFGAPKQDLWIHHYKEKFQVKVAIGLGGTLDYFAGSRIRAPKIFSKIGLEWMWRLWQQPKRMGRIIDAVVRFPWLIVRLKAGMVQS